MWFDVHISVGLLMCRHFNPYTTWAMRLVIPEARLLRLNFNPRTAWAMRHGCTVITTMHANISIHAPRERCDEKGKQARQYFIISIHAPRERCVGFYLYSISKFKNFNPRTVWAMRHREREKSPGRKKYFNPRTAWAMRLYCESQCQGSCYFNPRTAWAMRLLLC